MPVFFLVICPRFPQYWLHTAGGVFFARAEREFVPDLPSGAGSRRNLTWAQSCRRDMIGRRGTVGVSGGDDFWGDGGMFSSVWLSVF